MMNCVVNMLDLSWAHLLNWDEVVLVIGTPLVLTLKELM